MECTSIDPNIKLAFCRRVQKEKIKSDKIRVEYGDFIIKELADTYIGRKGKSLQFKKEWGDTLDIICSTMSEAIKLGKMFRKGMKYSIRF